MAQYLGYKSELRLPSSTTATLCLGACVKITVGDRNKVCPRCAGSQRRLLLCRYCRLHLNLLLDLKQNQIMYRLHTLHTVSTLSLLCFVPLKCHRNVAEEDTFKFSLLKQTKEVLIFYVTCLLSRLLFPKNQE